jgi:thymidylate synthase
MKKIVFLFLFLLAVSCSKDKKTQPLASIEKIEYIDLDYEKQPGVIINIKVNDSIIAKKLKNKELREFIIYSIKKEDRNYFFYEVWKAPIRKGNIFSFLIRTSYFSQNISDKEKKGKRIWNKDNITKALSGDIGLIFNKDTIHVKPSKDRKIVIQELND